MNHKVEFTIKKRDLKEKQKTQEKHSKPIPFELSLELLKPPTSKAVQKEGVFCSC